MTGRVYVPRSRTSSIRGPASLNMLTIDHLLSQSISPFLGPCCKIKTIRFGTIVGPNLYVTQHTRRVTHSPTLGQNAYPVRIQRLPSGTTMVFTGICHKNVRFSGFGPYIYIKLHFQSDLDIFFVDSMRMKPYTVQSILCIKAKTDATCDKTEK